MLKQKLKDIYDDYYVSRRAIDCYRSEADRRRFGSHFAYLRSLHAELSSFSFFHWNEF
jgi:hypothetical protein